MAGPDDPLMSSGLGSDLDLDRRYHGSSNLTGVWALPPVRVVTVGSCGVRGVGVAADGLGPDLPRA